MGLDIDILRPGDSLEGYALVSRRAFPSSPRRRRRPLRQLTALSSSAQERLEDPLVPSIPDSLPPGPLRSLIPMRVIEARLDAAQRSKIR